MSDCERWFWVPADGSSTRELTRWVDGTEVRKGIKARYAPKTVITRQVVPGRPGAMTTNRRHDWRTFPLPLTAVAESVPELQDFLAELAVGMDPADGPGVLRHVGLDDHVCELTAVQTADLDPEDFVRKTNPVGQSCVLAFEADEPYFVRDTVTDFVQGSDPSHWFGIGGTGAWVPIELGASAVLGDVTVPTNSDAVVWPVWDIVGPSSGEAIFTHRITHETWSLIFPALAAGEVVHVDLRPGVKTITGPGGVNYFRYLVDRELWPFYKGDNDITLSLSGSTSDSYIAWAYAPRKLAP